jgi:hypothetical protein
VEGIFAFFDPNLRFLPDFLGIFTESGLKNPKNYGILRKRRVLPVLLKSGTI